MGSTTSEECEMEIEEVVKKEFIIEEGHKIALNANDLKKMEKNLNTEKIEAILKSLPLEELKTKRLLFLLLSGSFNPVHRMHFETLEITKTYIEAHFNNVLIVGGFLATSSDHHVGGKVGESQAITLHHRNELIKLVTVDSPWISYCTLGCASGYFTTRMIEALLDYKFKNLIKGTKLSFFGSEICGSDLIERYTQVMNHPMICLERGEPCYPIRKLLKAPTTHPGFVYIDCSNDERMTRYVSSTQIRNCMAMFQDHPEKTDNFDEIAGDLHPAVIPYMLEHHNTLFLKNK